MAAKKKCRAVAKKAAPKKSKRPTSKRVTVPKMIDLLRCDVKNCIEFIEETEMEFMDIQDTYRRCLDQAIGMRETMLGYLNYFEEMQAEGNK